MKRKIFGDQAVCLRDQTGYGVFQCEARIQKHAVDQFFDVRREKRRTVLDRIVDLSGRSVGTEEQNVSGTLCHRRTDRSRFTSYGNHIHTFDMWIILQNIVAVVDIQADHMKIHELLF